MSPAMHDRGYVIVSHGLYSYRNQIMLLTLLAQAMANNMAGGMTGTNITGKFVHRQLFMVNDILHTAHESARIRASGTATQT
jgi:hypothetical protein